MKPVVAIIAHPDDETTMAGTLATFAKEKGDVHIICVTSGDAGENHHEKKEEMLVFIREDELRASAEILGVKHVSFVGFKDGSLSNNLYHQIAKKIENKVAEIQPETLITFEPRGITGHIDHMVISMVTTYLFNRLPYVKTLMYACMSEDQRKVAATLPEYFIYFPPGYKRSEVDQVVDVSHYWDKKIAAIRSHHSQKGDVETFILPIQEKAPKEEFFIVRCKQNE